MTTDDGAALAALRESIELALEVEGPAGGPLTREHLTEAVSYYALRYSSFPPGQLAREVHRTRSLIGAMLRQPQDDASRTELRLLAGWLSALVGNLAFHLGDYPAAAIHFSTAARLGTAVGHYHLICWSLGAFGDTHRGEAEHAMAAAQDQMAADPHGDQPGRFGFDTAELHLHLAEASLLLGDHAQARAHADVSQQHIPHGRPGWAAAVLVQARGEAARGRHSDATALAHDVLDTIAAPALRETLRVRLRERPHTLPPLVPVGHASGEPNGR